MGAPDEGFRSLFQLKKDRVHREEEHLYLGFSVGEQTYAVPIHFVREILKVPRLFSMPHVPNFVKGVIDLRGTIIPVLDLKERMGIGSVDHKRGRCVILTAGPHPLGILVDAVTEVFGVASASVTPPPEVLRQPRVAFIEGMVRSGDHLYLILDPGLVLTPKEMSLLSSQVWEGHAPKG